MLIDQAIPRILKAVSPLAGDQSKPTERYTLGAIPYTLDDKTATSPSTSDIRSSTFGTYSFSLPGTDQEHQCKTNPHTIDDSHDFLYLDSRYFNDDLKYQETFNPSPSDRRLDMISSHKHESGPFLSSAVVIDRNPMITLAMSHSITNPPNRSALCLICKHKKPAIFGNAPRRFTYREIENATDGFSDCNLMAEGGGYACVYRGELPDGQVITVKKYKKLNAFAESKFRLEVETVSCARHRNLLMLLGYCIDTELLLIYEYACNGSLDKHLYGKIEIGYKYVSTIYVQLVYGPGLHNKNSKNIQQIKQF